MPLTFSARPLTYRVSRKLSGSQPALAGRANEVVELAPGTTVRTAAAIALPGEELRATGTQDSTTLAAEQQSAHDGLGVNGATVAYRFDDALVADGAWYANGVLDTLRHQKRRVMVAGEAERLGEVQMCTDAGSEIFFGHWLCDALSTQLLAEDRGMPGINLPPGQRVHEPGYRALVGLASREVTLARVDTLWVVDDRGYNEQRRERFRRLRQRVRSHVAPGGGRRVFIDRGRSGAARHLVNRDQVLEYLTRQGFSVIAPETMEPAAIANALGSAELVVGVEGSHLNHALMSLPPGAGMLAIQPPDRFNMFNKYMCECASLRFGFTVADPARGGFVLEPERLARTIDLF